MTIRFFSNILLLIGLFFANLPFAFSQHDLVKTIYFKSNSYSIDKKYIKSLNFIAKQLSSDSFAYLKVFGYADTKGSDDYNDILSEKRATTVYDYLASHGKLDTTAVYVTSLGKSAEAYDLHFARAHIQQRCVDIWVMFRKRKVPFKAK